MYRTNSQEFGIKKVIEIFRVTIVVSLLNTHLFADMFMVTIQILLYFHFSKTAKLICE